MKNEKQLKIILDVMESLVRAAAAELRTAFGALAADDIGDKPAKNGLRDFGLRQEREVERTIRAALIERFTSIGFCGEESGGASSGLRFILDPVDGTNNFIHGKPEYGISLALMDGDDVIAAVLAAPEQNVIITAANGMGCLCDGRKVMAQPQALSDVLLDAELNFTDPASLSLLGRFANAVAGVRKAGSTVWAVTMMLAGKGGCGAIIADHLEPYDVAGCALALAEAGYFTSERNPIPARISQNLVAFPPLS